MTFEVMSPTAALLDGRYILEDRVGKGGMATVYRAQDTHLGRVVAIKMIHEGEADGEELGSADRAHTEKALLASLSHPALVTLFDAQLEPKRPQYLVMEYIDGPTLAERMADGPIGARELARIVRDLAEGLAVVHAAGIVHRDVKPSNVLMAPRTTRSGGAWAAKLADFGIAHSIGNSRMTSPGIVLGTLTYMAPEQLTDADPGTPVDIFALGLVAIEALTGMSAYPSLGSGRASAVARVGTAPVIPPSVEGEWRNLLERMTRLDPSERPTATEVARAARDLARTGGAETDETVAFAAGAAGVAGGAVAAGAAAAAGGAAAAGAGRANGAQAGAARNTGVPGRAGVENAAAANASTEAHAPWETRATAVLAPVDPSEQARPSRVRRGVMIGAAALLVVGGIGVGAAALTPPAEQLGRTASDVAVRTPVETTDPVTEVETVDDTPVETEPEAPVEPVTDQGNQGNGNEGNQGNGNEGNSNGNKGSDKKADNADKPKGKDK